MFTFLIGDSFSSPTKWNSKYILEADFAQVGMSIIEPIRVKVDEKNNHLKLDDFLKSKDIKYTSKEDYKWSNMIYSKLYNHYFNVEGILEKNLQKQQMRSQIS